jgi:hypothetical protein
MNIKKLVVDFASVFAVSLIVSVVVSVLWNLIVHGTSTIDWETSFRYAILFGIVFSWIEARRRR